MSMPSSNITVPSSVTDATSKPQANTSERKNRSTNSSTTIQTPDLKADKNIQTRYSKLNRINNPIPSTSKVEIQKEEESFDCPGSPSHCPSARLPLSQSKAYLCSCNPADDPKPGPSTSAAEFDLEVFDSCSSGSLEDCWGPDCHHSSCETSPVPGSTGTTIIARSGSRNKNFHRKGNKRQHSGSGISECGASTPSVNKASTSSGVFGLNHSKPLNPVFHHNFYDQGNTTLGEYSDNSSEEDFIMSSPGRAIPSHGHHYEPTSACPSETEDANLSDEKEDELERNDGSLYQKASRTHYSTTETMSVQEISNETSMDDIHHDVNELTDVEEEEQESESINASGLRNNIPTSNSNSHNLELYEDGNSCDQNEAVTSSEEKDGQIATPENHSNHGIRDSGQCPIVPTSHCSLIPHCQEGIILTACRCSQISRLDSTMHIHNENSTSESHRLASTLLNEELPSMISCKPTTAYSQVEKLSNDAHASSDNINDYTHQSQEISLHKNPDDMPSSHHVSLPGMENTSEPNLDSKSNISPTKNLAKGSPLPSTSTATSNACSPHLPHFVCHSHIHHHHIHSHASIHQSIAPRNLELDNDTDVVQDLAPQENDMDSEITVDKNPTKSIMPSAADAVSAVSHDSTNTTIRGTTQDVMTPDNVDEIVQDHDNFGTDECEDSLDSVATISLNETTSQDDEESSNNRSFQFSIKNQKVESHASNQDVLDAEESESALDTSGGLSGTKRKPDECNEDTPGPSNVKKKRINAIKRGNDLSVHDISPFNSTPVSAPRNAHKMNVNTIRGVSDVNMASAAFNLEDENDHDESVREKNDQPTSQDDNIAGRATGRQRCWSAGTLNTEEEICSAGNSNTSSESQAKSDSLDIVSDLSTCETVALALPCSISSSKNVFANVHNLGRNATRCCKCPIQICSKVSSEETNLSENENNCLEKASLEELSDPHLSCEDNESKSNISNFKNEESEPCDNENNSISNTSYCPAYDEVSNNIQVSPSVQQQLTKLIPDKNYPPNDILEWKDSFGRWSNAKRLLAIDQLISMCEPQQVRHMMAVIEPQFQRDFISLLPKELALYVLSFLKPRDLLNAAQTCRYWRILAEDNLLWREKCREAGLGDSVAEMFSARVKSHSKRMSCLSGIDGSSWKLGFMREHNIECNWRVRPIRTTKVLKGHDDHVITCLQFSNNKIVSGSDDNTLKVWNAITGRCLRTLVGHTGGVWSSQMEGNTIVSGSTDRSLKVWNAESGECVHTLYGHTSTVRCMHLHNNLVVSGSRDATLRMWDISSGECLHVLMGHVAAVRCVQFDGRLVVSGAYDYMVKVWNPITEECLHTLSGHTNRVYSLQFDGIHVVSGSLDTSIRVWDVETGSCKHALMGHQSLTSGMELKDNILVSGNADSTVKVWDITNGQCLQTLSGPNKHQSAVTCLQFDSKFVVTSSDDGTVKLWDVKTGEFIRDLVALKSGGSGGVVWRIRASATKLVCAVGSRNGTEETKLLVLDFDAPLEK